MDAQDWMLLIYIIVGVSFAFATRSFVLGLLWPGVLIIWLGVAVLENWPIKGFDQ